MAHKIYGNVAGLGAGQEKLLERLYQRRIDPNSLSTQQFNRELCELSHLTGKKLGVLANRKGGIEYVILGEGQLVFMPDLKLGPIRPGRFRGLRFIQTFLRGEPIIQENLADLALLRLDLVLRVEVTEQGYPGLSHLVHLKPANLQGEAYQYFEPFPPGQLELDFSELIKSLEDGFERERRKGKAGPQEGVILVKVVLSRKKGARVDRLVTESEMAELKALAESAGVAVLDRVIQQRERYHSHYLIGRGKLEEITVRAMQLGADTLVFDHELSPAQVSAIEDYTGLKVVDRSQLILDIFAQRAQSREGKIQVELAQYRYMLPRLVGKGTEMSRIVGGVGTRRGPGETKLETDRRRIKDRISHLEREFEQVRRGRGQRRTLRQRNRVPIVSIVGYTNTGKSTLLNALTNSNVRAENRLFATLDPSSRRIRFPRERELIITDTVGFIRNLPQELFQTFRATLEELADADLLLHIADAASPELPEQIQTVEKILAELDLSQKPAILVLNKSDLLDETGRAPLKKMFADSVLISALDRGTFMPLLMTIEEKLWSSRTEEQESWQALGYSGRA